MVPTIREQRFIDPDEAPRAVVISTGGFRFSSDIKIKINIIIQEFKCDDDVEET